MTRALAIDDNVLQSMGMGRVFKEGSARINSMDFSRTDDLLVTASDDDTIRLYNIASGTSLAVHHSKKYGVQNINFAHSNNTVIYASKRGLAAQPPVEVHRLMYLDLHTNKYERYFVGHTAQVNSLCMSPKNDLFLSAAQDKQVRLWDVRTAPCQGLLTVPGNPYASMDQQGLVFAVGTESGVLKLYDVRSYEKGPFTQFVVQEELNSPSCFADIKFSNDGKMIMAVVDGKVYLLDAFNGNILKKFVNGIPEGGTAVEASFSSDNQYLLSGCDDRSIRVWNIATGAQVAEWPGHAGVPGCLRWAPRRLLVASACSALALWIPNLPLLDSKTQSVQSH
ncbi:MAG: hypothetical protein WDW38_005630 [Sanguina aurantia]